MTRDCAKTLLGMPYQYQYPINWLRSLPRYLSNKVKKLVNPIPSAQLIGMDWYCLVLLGVQFPSLACTPFSTAASLTSFPIFKSVVAVVEAFPISTPLVALESAFVYDNVVIVGFVIVQTKKIWLTLHLSDNAFGDVASLHAPLLQLTDVFLFRRNGET